MRRKVTTRYQKAGSTPSARQRGAQSLAGPSPGLSPLARYIAENEVSGIPVYELVQQFQDYDCEHSRIRVSANSPSAQFLTCEDCGRTTKVEK